MASHLQIARVMRAFAVLACVCFGSGCVTVYQPLVGLQQPIAIDPQDPGNFVATSVLVRCHSSEGVEADVLCRNVRSSLSKQGATVATEVVKPQRASSTEKREVVPQYIIDVTSKVLHHEQSALMTLLCIASFTLVPAVADATYAQELTIRDSQGFLLAKDILQSRFIESFGLGVWAVNGLVDLIARPKNEQVTGDRYKEDFTRDFHGRLSQALHNAKVKTRVLESFSVAPAAAGKGP